MKTLSLALLLSLCWAAALHAQTAEQKKFAAEIQQHRNAYKEDFLVDSRSPLSAADTSMLDFYPPDPAYTIPARFERTPDAKPFELPTYSGKKRDYVQYGVLHFEFKGKPVTLNIYQNLRLVQDSTYRDHLFLPFKDLTNDETTYGGGRYLDFRQGDIKNDVLLLDFNKCYNPWCAYSDGYNCPIPPVPNHLDVAIEAGERIFKGTKKH